MGATHPIAKMAIRMSPVFLDTPSPEQGNGDLLMGCRRKRAIQNLEHADPLRAVPAESKRVPAGRYP